MKEIKFKVWDKDNKRMITSDCLNLTFSNGEIEAYFETLRYDMPYEEKIENPIILQYVGLKDKNGKEIYEGDLVKYFRNELAIIKYKYGSFVIESETELEYFTGLCGKIEVVGNIYQDKNLLEK